MARQDNVQATQPHQSAGGGFSFAKRDELTAKIGKSEVGLPNVSRSPIVFANLLRTDGRLPRSWQFHAMEREKPFECLLSNTQNRLDRLAEQFNTDLNQKKDGRNRYQVDIPLHVAPQSSRRFNLGVVDWLCLLRPCDRCLPDQSTLMDRYPQGRIDRGRSTSANLVNGMKPLGLDRASAYQFPPS